MDDTSQGVETGPGSVNKECCNADGANKNTVL